MWVTGMFWQQLFTGLCRVAHSDWTCPVFSLGVHAPRTTIRAAWSPTSGKWWLTQSSAWTLIWHTCPDLAWTCLYMLACLGLSIVCWHELGYTWVEPLILLDGVPGLLLDEVIGTVIVRDTTRSPTVLQWYHLQSTLNSIFVFQKWIETLSLITRYNSANTICTSRPSLTGIYN